MTHEDADPRFDRLFAVLRAAAAEAVRVPGPRARVERPRRYAWGLWLMSKFGLPRPGEDRQGSGPLRKIS